MATLITGLGLVGTSYAQLALKRGESIVFYDVAPRKDFLAHKLGTANVTVVQRRRARSSERWWKPCKNTKSIKSSIRQA